MQGRSHEELPRADDLEAVPMVEADGGMVLAVDAEQQAGGAELPGAVHGPPEKRTAAAVSLKAVKHINSLKFEVARFWEDGEVGRAEDGVAHGGAG